MENNVRKFQWILSFSKKVVTTVILFPSKLIEKTDTIEEYEKQLFHSAEFQYKEL